jgi:undecaprenyl-diphosphatase
MSTAAFTAVIQIGTEAAVLIYFRKDIWRIAAAWVRSLHDPSWRGHADARMGWYIIVGSLPIVALGITLKDVIEHDFRSLWIIGTTLVVLGVVLGVADRVGSNERGIRQMALQHALLLGLAQAAALVPGVSRSGATISMGRFLGYEREAATRFAFLLAIPAVIGAGLFELQEIPGNDPVYGWGPTIVATVVSFAVGYAAIAWLLRYVSTHSYLPFVLYRVALGSFVLAMLGAGVLSA